MIIFPTPNQLSPIKKWAALLALALGGFGIGVNEFVTMGLLPEIAQNLLPELWAVDREQATADAGMMISAYAAGVVVGAPLITALVVKWSKKRLVLLMLIWVAATTVVSALLPSLNSIMLVRFLTALPHGVYFGVASIIAAGLMGPGSRAKGVALVLGGLTIANVVGVPLTTWVGQLSGWRLAYLIVGAIFALTFVAVLITVPAQPGNPHATVRTEFRAFKSIHVWLTIGMGAIGFGGFFACYSYIAPLATEVSGVSAGVVPWVLVVTGIGMTLGNILGGKIGDKSIPLTLLLAFVLMMFALIFGLLFLSTGAVALFVFGFVLGFGSSVISPPAQSRFMQVAPGSETIAAASHHSAFNVANSLGAYLGGIVIAMQFGYLSTLYVGVILLCAGAAFAVTSFLIEKRRPIKAPAAV